MADSTSCKASVYKGSLLPWYRSLNSLMALASFLSRRVDRQIWWFCSITVWLKPVFTYSQNAFSLAMVAVRYWPRHRAFLKYLSFRRCKRNSSSQSGFPAGMAIKTRSFSSLICSLNLIELLIPAWSLSRAITQVIFRSAFRLINSMGRLLALRALTVFMGSFSNLDSSRAMDLKMPSVIHTLSPSLISCLGGCQHSPL